MDLLEPLNIERGWNEIMNLQYNDRVLIQLRLMKFYT